MRRRLDRWTQRHTHIYTHGGRGEGEEAEEEDRGEEGEKKEEKRRVQTAQTCPLLSRLLVQSRAGLWAVS